MTRRSFAAAAALPALLGALGCSHGGAANSSHGSGAILDLESFLTNISDPFTERYCKVTVKLVLSPPELVASIKGDPLLLAKIRDRILTLITTKTALDLGEAEGKEAFREEIRTGVTELLAGGRVDQVLFSEFVVQ